jgi:rhamnogalacturonan endolyase
MKGLTLSTLSLLVCAGLSAQPNYDYSTIQREKLGRGVVCIRDNDSVTISWRYLSTDKANTAFNIYSNGKRLNPSPLVSSTFFRYPAKDKTTKYSVVPVIDGKETKEGKADYTLFKESSKPYISIPLNRPADVQIDGRMCQYSANDASVGDVDGDGTIAIGDVTALIDLMLEGEIDRAAYCDINLDGNVTIADVTALIDQLLGNS